MLTNKEINIAALRKISKALSGLKEPIVFVGGAEERIRTKLLKDNNVDAVIGLAPNLFYSTGIQVCILVLKKFKKEDDVLFINTSKSFEKCKRQNSLTEQNIDDIIETYKYRKSIARYSPRVPMDEIIQNSNNLNISRYISTSISEEEVDLHSVNEKLNSINKEIEAATEKHNQYLKELGLPLI